MNLINIAHPINMKGYKSCIKMLGRCSIAVIVLGLGTEKWKEFCNTTDTNLFQFLLSLFASTNRFFIFLALSFSHNIFFSSNLLSILDLWSFHVHIFLYQSVHKETLFLLSSNLFRLPLLIITTFCITKYHVILFIISLF